MVVSLSHTGQETLADRFSSIVGRADFTVEGVVVDEHPLITEEHQLESVSIVGVVLENDGLLLPSRAITIAGIDGKIWRFDYAVKLGQTDITPPMRDLLGHAIRLYVRRETWGVTPFYGALITDERNLVLALDSGALDVTQYPNLTITQGPRIEVAGAEGGVSRLRRFTFPDSPSLLLAPGQCQSVWVDEGVRTTCNLWCTYWHDDHVTDVVNEITWVSWLARDNK
jgi:hypothetical protein